MITSKISPCLWYDNEAEDAAKLYTSIFKNSKIGAISRYSEVGFEHHHKQPGSVMMVSFELDGVKFCAMNGGPNVKFSWAVSFMVSCDTQEEIDYYWARLTADGGEENQCGWLKDKFGLSWQIVPSMLDEIMSDPERAKRAFAALLQMKKLDIEKIKNA